MVTKSIAWNTGTGNITLTYQGQGNGTIAVASDANDLGSVRSQTIIVQTTDGVVTQNLTVSQAACPVPVGTILNYSYTGAVQEVTLPAGTYKLQCWGAQGGSGSSYTGGKGGYSEGVVTLNQPTTLYIFVGGKGASSGNGGWNGGGGGSGSSSYSSDDDYGSSTFGCGGGATDIATVSSTMSYSSYRTARDSASLLARMIVAGGGSGGSYAYRRYTTSTTVWNSYDSGSQEGKYHNGWYYYARSSWISVTAGSTYRVKLSASSTTYLNRLTYMVYDATQSSLKTDGILSNNSWSSFTAPSGSSYMRLYADATSSCPDESSAPGFSYQVEIQESSSTTSTDSDATYGYVGGGVNGGGYSSTYYGKQNGAGSNGGFGYGANQTVSNYRYAGGCGGGGWYGGGNSYADSGISTVKCSGGGSGFVNIAANSSYRPSGYTGLELDSGATYAGSTSFPNTAGTGNETGHAGNGYAKITRIAAYSITLRFKDEEDSPITGTSVTVSNSEYTYSLTTDSNGEATANMINGTYNLSCSGYSLDPSQITVSSNSTIDIVAAAPSIMDFSYTGAVQNTTLKAGTYKIECWGAQGGSYNGTYYGGKGGYSVGKLTLSESTTIYVYAGGQGTGGTTSGAKAGGFNGGGLGFSPSTTQIECGGGGASDVRIGQDSLYARVIVAGGGGGAGTYNSSYRYAGGAGGGTSGATPSQYSTSYKAGTGGTATARGNSYYGSTVNSTTYGTLANFGIGAGAISGDTSRYITGGGGGWYGGGYGGRAAGGGGSGYVYNASTASNYPSGCLLNSEYYLADAETKAGNTSIPSTSYGTETGHEGNGYVRITKIS